ncbi:rhodanese-like domain-containing protein [Candidatus Vondammii sp. HM_W22]|uniref:rhodanese-like domain-containing protein n=1 Tax=Candidatus Vondammii sp. HM_W22 TaxID=2687299 RepID=UPI001F12A794|nr:rhodanese-like domain-containing protein [Candidatus Vondammii sp. HM_W22]
MNFYSSLLAILLFLLTIGSGFAISAEEVPASDDESSLFPLYKGKPYLHVIHQGRSVKVHRVEDPDYQFRGYFAKTIRKCPPFCIKPILADPRVKTVGEIELFDFMENQLREGTGVLIDARTVGWYGQGTIPGSVNIPFTILSKDIGDLEMEEVIESFGVKQRKDVGAAVLKLEEWGVLDGRNKTSTWDFSQCKELILWCNGPTCGQSPRAIRGLLKAGYPAEKIGYYRGGMMMWQLLGLTTVLPES